jgi:hypothetical protein
MKDIDIIVCLVVVIISYMQGINFIKFFYNDKIEKMMIAQLNFYWLIMFIIVIGFLFVKKFFIYKKISIFRLTRTTLSFNPPLNIGLNYPLRCSATKQLNT